MCFSASASFAASGLTAVAGVAAFTGARQPAYRLLAAMPLFFALQQLAEGVVWLAAGGRVDPAWQVPAAFAFLLAARVLWPAWVPLMVRAAEEDPGRRRVLSVLLALGVLEGLLGGYALAAYPVTVDTLGHHVRYGIAAPAAFRVPVDVLYYLVTLPPLFLSGHRALRGIGVAMLAALVVSRLFYREYAVSVWCFFAAFISVLVLVAVVRAGARPAARPA
jgi:hypothetical protein